MTTAQNNTAQTDGALEYHTDLPVGEILRRTRVHYNQSLQDVADFMRIRSNQLEAIEKGDLDQLPGRVYAIGYIRTYSEYLGLDGEKMIQLFKQQTDGKAPRPELHFPVAASETKAPNFSIIFVSLAALVLVLGVWMILGGEGGKDTQIVSEIPNVPAEIRVAAAQDDAEQAAVAAAGTGDVTAENSASSVEDMSSATTTSTADAVSSMDPLSAPDAAVGVDGPVDGADSVPLEDVSSATIDAAPAPEANQIMINVKQRSWVEVRDLQGKVILSRILKPGEVFIVPEENYGLRLDTGNAGGLELSVNGQKLPALGREGDILRGLVLEGASLVKRANEPPSSSSITPSYNR